METGHSLAPLLGQRARGHIAALPRDSSVSVGKDYIGPYRLLKLVRAGKATQIWEAMNPADNRRVALKSLHGAYIDDKNEINGLRHEYLVGRELEHEAVNRVYEFNIARGIPYVVMDFFNAPNLKQLFRQDPERVKKYRVPIIEQAADGLHHMHQVGWVHRDVKPDNLLLSDEGQLKLIDFAISQKIKKKGWGLLGKKNQVMGTRSYMAPEQIRGGSVDGRADVYGLGCVVFEIFSGRPPFTGNNPDDLLTKHLRAPIPSLSAFCDEITPEFSQLVARMMAKKVDARPESMGKFRTELDDTRVLKTRRSMSDRSA
jgi:serine/threonine protein kinase